MLTCAEGHGRECLSTLQPSQSTSRACLDLPCCRRPIGPPPPYYRGAPAPAAAAQQLAVDPALPPAAFQTVPLATAPAPSAGASCWGAGEAQVVRLTEEQIAALPEKNAWSGEPRRSRWFG